MHALPLGQEGLTPRLCRAADESIPPAGDGGDVPRIRRLIVERTPQHKYALRQIGVFDNRVRPDAAHEVTLLNRPASVVQEHLKDIEGFRRHADGFIVSRQAPSPRVESEWTESVNLCHGYRPE